MARIGFYCVRVSGQPSAHKKSIAVKFEGTMEAIKPPLSEILSEEQMEELERRLDKAGDDLATGKPWEEVRDAILADLSKAGS